MASLSDLESVVKRLNDSSDSLSSWLEFWTALVVLGLVVEYIHDVWKFFWEKPRDWSLLKQVVGGVLITVGVAGELVNSWNQSALETERRDVNSKIVALLNKEAEDARLARVNLEKLIQPRRLTSEQEDALRAKAAAVAGTRVVFQVYDAEGWALARQLGIVLVGWDARNIAWAIPGETVAFGVVVEAWGDENHAAAELLVNELTVCGIKAALGPSTDSSALNVRIGVKPLPE